jgi:2-hydroxy-6-oxonona-2,4-dienedioate hydrolase
MTALAPARPVPLLAYEYLPQAQGRAPVVLVPGLFAGGWMWDDTCTELSRHGFGVVRLMDALAAVDDIGVAALGEALGAILERLELRRVSVCANSFGALVALDFAVRHPEAVESVVLSGSPGLAPDVNLGTGVPRTVSREYVVGLARSLFYDPARATPAMIDRTHALLSDRRHVRNVVRALRAARDYPLTETLQCLTCRTLFVWGEHDSVTPVGQWRQIASQGQRSTFRTVPRCGHSPMVEQPHEFNRILLEFLDA